MKKSKFSVLIPVYWREDPKYFDCALNSIFANTWQPTEVILVCDGPLTDELDAVIEKHSTQSALKIVRLESNKGITSAVNIGLSHTTTNIIVRCDSDVVNDRDRFWKLVSKIDRCYSVVGTQVKEVDDSGTELKQKSLPIKHKDIVRYAKSRNPINHMSVAFIKKDVLEVGGYPDLFLKEDYALWAKMIGKRKKFENLPCSLVEARAGIQMYSRRGGYRAARSELSLQRILINAGISTPLEALLFDWLDLWRSLVL